MREHGISDEEWRLLEALAAAKYTFEEARFIVAAVNTAADFFGGKLTPLAYDAYKSTVLDRILGRKHDLVA